EDGIRDFHVTGVQTCALPIYSPKLHVQFYVPSRLPLFSAQVVTATPVLDLLLCFPKVGVGPAKLNLCGVNDLVAALANGEVKGSGMNSANLKSLSSLSVSASQVNAGVACCNKILNHPCLYGALDGVRA